MFTVYAIRSKTTKRIYIGQTNNFEKRIKQHNNRNFDKRSYTKLSGSNWELIYKEEYKTRKEALIREKFLKSHKGRDWLKSIIKGP